MEDNMLIVQTEYSTEVKNSNVDCGDDFDTDTDNDDKYNASTCSSESSSDSESSYDFDCDNESNYQNKQYLGPYLEDFERIINCSDPSNFKNLNYLLENTDYCSDIISMRDYPHTRPNIL